MIKEHKKDNIHERDNKKNKNIFTKGEDSTKPRINKYVRNRHLRMYNTPNDCEKTSH